MNEPQRGEPRPPKGTSLKKTRVSASRSVLLRDFAIFQVKLILDGAKDFVLSAMSLVALVVDLFSGGGRKPRHFYTVLAMSERFDAWLNLSGAVTRLETEELDDDGLFAASESGSDTLLGRIEEMVRGGDRPPGPPRGERDRPDREGGGTKGPERPGGGGSGKGPGR